MQMRLGLSMAALSASLVSGCNCGAGLPVPIDGGHPDALLVEAVPLVVYSSCGRDPGPVNQFDRCVYVRVTSGGQTRLAEWTVCGDTICAFGQGYGEGPIGVDGKPTRPVLFRCLPDDGAPIQVDVCAPGYALLSMTMPPKRLTSPDQVLVAQRNLQACPAGAFDYFLASYGSFEITYPLVPVDGGDACPLAPDGGLPQPASVCPCPP
jgi:hypothetical protein